MNENIDLTKILKNCPKGWKFYSSLLGEVEFERIGNDGKHEPSIIVKPFNCDYTDGFTKEGFYFTNIGECTLFPSKDQRDWSKFSASWYKKEKFDPRTLKPFDKILVRDSCKYMWKCAFYSHQRTEEKNAIFKYATTANSYIYCIPYNEDTKHLVGTTDDPIEYYKYWED